MASRLLTLHSNTSIRNTKILILIVGVLITGGELIFLIQVPCRQGNSPYKYGMRTIEANVSKPACSLIHSLAPNGSTENVVAEPQPPLPTHPP